MVNHKNWKKPERGKQSWSGPFRTKMKPSKKEAEEEYPEDTPEEIQDGISGVD